VPSVIVCHGFASKKKAQLPNLARREWSCLTANAFAYWGGTDVRSNLAVPFKEELETTPPSDARLAALLDLLVSA
jgi:hypothetical protein